MELNLRGSGCIIFFIVVIFAIGMAVGRML